MQYNREFDLTNYNSFHLQSTAKEIWFPETFPELINLLNTLQDKSFNVLSYGSNVLFNGTIDRIICLKKMPNNLSFDSDGFVLSDANVLTNNFAKEVINHNYKGTEGLLGIPGSIGAAIIGNSGSGKYCISDFLRLVFVVDYKGNIITYTKEDLKFSRRYSILQNKNQILLYALFKFDKPNPDKEVIQQTLEYRQNFPKGYNAGGLFKNWNALKPYEKEIRTIKSPNLYVSKQLNVIINKGDATYEEILNFINQIKNIVKESLELEIKLIG